MPELRGDRMITPNPTPSRLAILLDNYRESRAEGMKLAQSSASDIAITAALIGAVIGAQHLTNEPTILLLLPLLLAGLLFYAIIKFRGSSLVTSYMIFLERAINIEVGEPVMLWNTHIIRRSVSAGRRSLWGTASIALAALVVLAIYTGLCAWAFIRNLSTFVPSRQLSFLFVALCAFLGLVNLVALIATLRTIRTYTPQHIERLSRESPI